MISRLFISLDIPEKEIDKIILLRNEIYGQPNELNWKKKEKLHITLKFLGDVGENVSELLLRRMEGINFNRFEAKFDKFSFFKRRKELKILFASLKPNLDIQNLHNIIEEECELIGFEKENRKFHPHITFLRIKGGENFNRLIKFNNLVIDGSEFTVNSFSIFKSELRSTGSEYTKIKSFKLD